MKYPETVKVGDMKITRKGNIKWKWVNKWVKWGYIEDQGEFSVVLDPSFTSYIDDSTSFHLSQKTLANLNKAFAIFIRHRKRQ